MNSLSKQFVEEANYLLSEVQSIIDGKETESQVPFSADAMFVGHQSDQRTVQVDVFDNARITALYSGCLSFALKVYQDENHPMFQAFRLQRGIDDYQYLLEVISLLGAVKNQIVQGWLVPFSKIVTADIFSNTLDASKHLLDQGYKDAAAVMIGSTLESHLRELAKNTQDVDIHDKKGKLLTGGALNQNLRAAGVYDASKEKAATFYLDTRNHAAHGRYSEYTEHDVTQMYSGVVIFISQT